MCLHDSGQEENNIFYSHTLFIAVLVQIKNIENPDLFIFCYFEINM